MFPKPRWLCGLCFRWIEDKAFVKVEGYDKLTYHDQCAGKIAHRSQSIGKLIQQLDAIAKVTEQLDADTISRMAALNQMREILK